MMKLIPENKRAAVVKGLRAAFGVDVVDDIRELTAGLSTALIFRMVVQGHPYLLRVIIRSDTIADPAIFYPAMKAGSDAGIAPQILYFDMEERVLITDFIEAKPFPIKVAKVKMPELMRVLHALPSFPDRMNYVNRMDGVVQQLKTAGLLPPSVAEGVFEQYERTKTIYPRIDTDIVSCHNDLKPENVLYDGEQVWLVDWEAAFMNDRYLDLAVVANFVVATHEDEKLFLEAYFQAPATPYQHARLFLMQQLLSMFYTSLLLILAERAGTNIDMNMPRPGFRDFHDGIWNGQISLAGMDERVQYALVHLDNLQHNLQSARYEGAITAMIG